jgi:hypothetical protein
MGKGQGGDPRDATAIVSTVIDSCRTVARPVTSMPDPNTVIDSSQLGVGVRELAALVAKWRAVARY